MPLAPEPTLAVGVTSGDHVRGSVAAPVTIVEYGDYECPYCAAAERVLAAALTAQGDRVRLVFRNFPLPDVHPYALTAALAAEAAAALGAFWEMHDILFTRQDRLRDIDIAGYAESLGYPERRSWAMRRNRTARRWRPTFGPVWTVTFAAHPRSSSMVAAIPVLSTYAR